jgi:hypothetical protein
MPTTVNGRPAANHLAGDRSAKKSVTFVEFCRHQLNGINGLSYMHTPPPFVRRLFNTNPPILPTQTLEFCVGETRSQHAL